VRWWAGAACVLTNGAGMRTRWSTATARDVTWPFTRLATASSPSPPGPGSAGNASRKNEPPECDASYVRTRMAVSSGPTRAAGPTLSAPSTFRKSGSETYRRWSPSCSDSCPKRDIKKYVICVRAKVGRAAPPPGRACNATSPGASKAFTSPALKEPDSCVKRPVTTQTVSNTAVTANTIISELTRK